MSAAEDDEGLAKDLEAMVAARHDLDPTYEPALSSVPRAGRQARRSRTGGIPITAVAGNFGDVLGIAIAWAGIVGVNLSAAWGARRKRRR